MPRLFRTHLCAAAERLISREGWFGHTGGVWEASARLPVQRGHRTKPVEVEVGVGRGKETTFNRVFT